MSKSEHHRAVAEQEIAERALPVLGWNGYVLVRAQAWSTQRLVACRLDPEEHQRRVSAGLVPVTDPLLLHCIGAENPAFLWAKSPVQIAGAIAVRRTWSGAISNLGGFSAFGGLVAILPASQADRLHVAVGASVEGFGVIALDDEGDVMRLVHHPDVRPRVCSRTWVHRLVEEILYDALLVTSAPMASGSHAETPRLSGIREFASPGDPAAVRHSGSGQPDT